MSYFNYIIKEDQKGKVKLSEEVRKFLRNLPKGKDTEIYQGN
jgi:hypothetical protein